MDTDAHGFFSCTENLSRHRRPGGLSSIEEVVRAKEFEPACLTQILQYLEENYPITSVKNHHSALFYIGFLNAFPPDAIYYHRQLFRSRQNSDKPL
jgi:hypothetical protein